MLQQAVCKLQYLCRCLGDVGMVLFFSVVCTYIHVQYLYVQ